MQLLMGQISGLCNDYVWPELIRTNSALIDARSRQKHGENQLEIYDYDVSIFRG